MKNYKHPPFSEPLFQIHPPLISVYSKINNMVKVQEDTHPNGQNENWKLNSKQLNPEKWDALIKQKGSGGNHQSHQKMSSWIHHFSLKVTLLFTKVCKPRVLKCDLFACARLVCESVCEWESAKENGFGIKI